MSLAGFGETAGQLDDGDADACADTTGAASGTGGGDATGGSENDEGS